MPLIAGPPDCFAGLSKRIRDAMLASMESATDNAELRAMAHAIAVAVVEEIQANATVVPLGLIAPPGMAGGPVTGAGTIL